MKFWSFVCSFLLVFCGAQVAFGMTSTNYQINWDQLNQGGLDTSTSTNYRVHSTIGEPFAGTSTSTNYSLREGYRAGEGGTVLSLTVRTQASNVEVAYSSFTTTTPTVVVSSVSAFSVGDYIGVVENKGFAALVAVGKITAIGGQSGLTITVDRWDGNHLSMTGSPSGGNDYVYQLNAETFAFGTLSAGTEHTSLAVSSVETNVASYTVYLNANQELKISTSTAITNVSDGTVSIGSEEYGAEEIGNLAVNSGSDIAVTTTLRAIQTTAALTGNVQDRVALLYKLSITAATSPGSYTQSVYYTLTKNF